MVLIIDIILSIEQVFLYRDDSIFDSVETVGLLFNKTGLNVKQKSVRIFMLLFVAMSKVSAHFW
jgi:hypothetical protein